MEKNENYKEIIQWGCEYLLSHGYTLRSDSPENVQNTPLNKLADLFARLLTQKDLLVEDGLEENEIEQLERLIPTVAICFALKQRKHITIALLMKKNLL